MGCSGVGCPGVGGCRWLDALGAWRLRRVAAEILHHASWSLKWSRALRKMNTDICIPSATRTTQHAQAFRSLGPPGIEAFVRYLARVSGANCPPSRTSPSRSAHAHSIVLVALVINASSPLGPLFASVVGQDGVLFDVLIQRVESIPFRRVSNHRRNPASEPLTDVLKGRSPRFLRLSPGHDSYTASHIQRPSVHRR